MSKQNFEELVLQKLTNIESKVDNLETDVKVLKDDVKVLKDDVKVLKDDVKVLKDDVKVLKDDVKVLKVKTDNLEKGIHSLNIKTSIMDKKIDGLYGEVNNLEGAIELNTSYINQSFKTMSSNMFSYDKRF